MSDIRKWLTSLDLGGYAEAFEANRIDLDLLPSLDHELLKELGVIPIGDRLRILKSAADLEKASQELELELEHVAAQPTGSAVRTEPGGEAERRQLTVLFCDLVGSTALSEGMDPEEYRDVLGGYQSAAAAAVQRYEGFIARYMGDGLLVYFGYPQAHEDDAERAIRAGFHIIDRVTALTTGPQPALEVRIGVATGTVVVGDIIGEGVSQERAVVGDTPNLAARLQGIAEANTVYLSESTRRLVGGLFECEDLGSRNLKGFSNPVPIWRLVRERVVGSRFEAHASGSIARLSGREHELGLVLERWAQARRGEGQMVLLSGEAGIGKSRITRALLDSVADEEHVRIFYQCSPYHTDSALYPTIEQLRRAAGLVANESSEVQLDRLEGLLEEAVDEVDSAAPLVAALLGIDGVARYGAIQMTPQQQRRRTLETLCDQLLGLASKKSCLLVVEDAHWIDPTTLELVQMCLERVERTRVLMLLTARPTFAHQFGGHPIVTQLTLNRLGRPQTLEIISALSGGRSMPEELIEAIASKTDGVPLFVEELTKTVLESSFLRLEGDTYALEGPIQNLSIPASLHDSLMARLDRLESVKEVAQAAACIGREFNYAFLSKVIALSSHELVRALSHLCDAELVFCRGTPPTATYTFKHALVQDAAYESLLKVKRQQIHGRLVAALLEETDAAPEILAHHAEAAGFIEQAIQYWQRAGESGLARSSNQEAVAHLSSAIRLIASLDDGASWKEVELELQVALGQALIATDGYAAHETARAFDRALELTVEVGSTPLRLPALYGRWVVPYVRGVPAKAYANELYTAAIAESDVGAQIVGLRMRALEEAHSGNFPDALELLDEALGLYEPDQHKRLGLMFGHDPRAASLIYKRWLLWLLGYPDQADAAGREALEWAEEVGHANTLGIVRCWGLVLPEILQRRPAEVEKQAHLAIALSEEHRMPLWRAWSRIFLGWARVQQSHAESDLEEMQIGLREAELTEAGRFKALTLALYAESNSIVGRHEVAQRVMDAAFEALVENRDSMFEAELYRLRGDVRWRAGLPDTNSVRDDLESAVAVARRQQSPTLELRATLSMTRALVERSDSREAARWLAPLYDRFTEGLETQDLLEARRFIDAAPQPSE